jgi:hypothetical protein
MSRPKGFTLTAEHRAKIGGANTGKSPSVEAREKMRTAKLGNRFRRIPRTAAYLKRRRLAARARRKKWASENPEKHREAQRNQSHKKRHGEPFTNKLARLKAQGYRCANAGCRTTIPGGPKAQWNTDHNHLTGKIRGELCWNCNIALGHLRDDEFIAEGLAEYLRKHNLGE